MLIHLTILLGQEFNHIQRDTVQSLGLKFDCDRAANPPKRYNTKWAAG